MNKKVTMIMVLILALILAACSSTDGGDNNADANEVNSPEGWTETTLQKISYLKDDSWTEQQLNEYSYHYDTDTYTIAIVYDSEKIAFTSVDDFIEQSKELMREERWNYTLEDYEVSDWENEDYQGKLLVKTVTLNEDAKEQALQTYQLDGDPALMYQVAFMDDSDNLVYISGMSYSDDEKFKVDIETLLNSLRPATT